MKTKGIMFFIMRVYNSTCDVFSQKYLKQIQHFNRGAISKLQM